MLAHQSYDDDRDNDDGISVSSSENSTTHDIESSTDDRSSARGGNGNNNHATGLASSAEEKFVQQETRHVLFLRVVVILVLICAAVAVSIVVFMITQDHEIQNFDADYDAAATKVTDTFLDILRTKMGSAASLAVAVVAHGVDHPEDWPFVTLSSFQQRSASVKESSGALYVGTNPIVQPKDRAAWENYTAYGPDAQWHEEGLDYQRVLGLEKFDERPQVETEDPDLDFSTGIATNIYSFFKGSTNAVVNPVEEHRYLPVWQTSPVTKRSVVNQNIARSSDAAKESLAKYAVTLDRMERSEPGYANSENPDTSEVAFLLSMANRKRTFYLGDVFTSAYFPIYSDFTPDRKMVGVMRILLYWSRYFENVLPSDTTGVVFVLDDGCGEPYTYMINGKHVLPVGTGDLHDENFDDMKRGASFEQIDTIQDGTKLGLSLYHGDCPYAIRVYPSVQFQERYQSRTPFTITMSVAVVFFFAVILFLVYDRLVERRQSLIMKKATQTHHIVASLFPRNVRDRLLDDNNDEQGDGSGGKGKGLVPATNSSGDHQAGLEKFLNTGKGSAGNNPMSQSVIADLFPNCTVFLADLAGFTAWSSSRDPAQVFVLLQNLYKAFDGVARRRNVFKVETIGDSYLAVTGLPDPQPQHAVIMCRFAAECLAETARVTTALETSLGPDTGDLKIRIGLHSGPVTGGVLRGERSRFQLFGDTVNTAARMESTGVAGRIQASKSTVDILINSGKKHWVRKRTDDVVAKGKGVLSTFWITPNAKKASSSSGVSDRSSSNVEQPIQGLVQEDGIADTAAAAESTLKKSRLVDWMVQIMQEHIVPVVNNPKRGSKTKKAAASAEGSVLPRPQHWQGRCSLDELVEVIELPEFDPNDSVADRKKEAMDEDVKSNLRTYVTIIASAYRDNPFHNFEHACHVTMNVVKFLKRIVSSEVDNEYTHGLNSDPIVVLAIVFSALVHDVDHRGISNEQLMKEDPNMSACFQHTCVAEQNSLSLAFDLLMSDQFQLVRDYIFKTHEELSLFRQVLVNVVLATDIFDKELNAQRKARWVKAFSEGAPGQHRNRMRATIVMEHIIQASDVCHTMQHWHIYRKWNKRLFFELMVAHRDGRMSADPAKFWYKGEIGFFDNYVIPLAKKLEDCKVFGVSSDECLNYALGNRNEWEARGKQLVEEMVEEFADSEWSQARTASSGLLRDTKKIETLKEQQQQEESSDDKRARQFQRASEGHFAELKEGNLEKHTAALSEFQAKDGLEIFT